MDLVKIDIASPTVSGYACCSGISIKSWALKIRLYASWLFSLPISAPKNPSFPQVGMEPMNFWRICSKFVLKSSWYYRNVWQRGYAIHPWWVSLMYIPCQWIVTPSIVKLLKALTIISCSSVTIKVGPSIWPFTAMNK